MDKIITAANLVDYENDMLRLAERELQICTPEIHGSDHSKNPVNYDDELPYIILDHTTKKKYIYKPAYITNAQLFFKKILSPPIDKPGDEILQCLHECFSVAVFLPDIITDLDNFIEITYYDEDQWRKATVYDYISNTYLEQIDTYMNDIENLEMYIDVDTINVSNTYVNKNTGEIKLVNVGDIELVDSAMPGVFPINSRTFGNEIGANAADSCILITDYSWSNPKYNIPRSEYGYIVDTKYGHNLTIIENPTVKMLNILSQRYSKATRGQ